MSHGPVCPLCGDGPMREEQTARDSWAGNDRVYWICENCEAEFDPEEGELDGAA